MRPVCGIAIDSMSSEGDFVDFEPSRDVIKCLQAISGTMGIKPSVGIVANTKKPILEVDKLDGKRDGVICINELMIKKILAEKAFAFEILTGLLSHEFCHVYQLRNDCELDFNAFGEDTFGVKRGPCFTNLITDGSKRILELHSDFMAGWVMARLDLLTTSTFGGYTKRIFADGDYNFTLIDHHGTPRERLNAMANGFMFGRTGNVPGYDSGQFIERLSHSADKTSAASAFLVGQATLAGRKY